MSMRARHVHLSASVNKLVQFNLSDIGEGIREVTVRNWFVKENDVVEQFDDICEVESDKATVSITSRFDGRVTKLYHKIGDVALVGKPLVDIDVEDDGTEDVAAEEERVEESRREPSVEKPSAELAAAESVPEEYSEKNWNKSLATPAVRRIAMENNISLKDVKGTGKNGRVMKEDILAFVGLSKPTYQQHSNTVPLTTVQKVMTKTMSESLKIPQFVLSDEVDMSRLVRLRSEAKEIANKKGIKLSYLPFIVKAVSKSLSEFPVLNSSFDIQREEIVLKPSHNIGLAVDSPAGLLVPNIKNVQSLSISEIAKEMNRLQDLAKKMKLLPADLTGGTFSVSNIGTIAGTTATPLVLPPEVCILALGRLQRVPRYDSSGSVVPVDIMSVSWSADHRIIDGATVARCSLLLRHYLENPSALLLDL